MESSKIPDNSEVTGNSLGRVNLRANLLRGNIVLGNYGVSGGMSQSLHVTFWTGSVLKVEHAANYLLRVETFGSLIIVLL